MKSPSKKIEKDLSGNSRTEKCSNPNLKILSVLDSKVQERTCKLEDRWVEITQFEQKTKK